MDLNNPYLKTLVEEDLHRAMMLRFPTWTKPVMVKVSSDGVADVTTCLPNGNWCSIKLSMRGIDAAYQWLDRMEHEFQAFAMYLYGIYKPTEEYGKDVDWTKKV